MTKIKHEVVNWAKDPTKDLRLLDWLEENDAEREVLFSIAGVDRKRGGKTLSSGTLSKKMCGERAAVGIFTADADRTLWSRCKQDPVHYGQVVIWHISHHWKEKYRAFNNKIGARASILPYSEIRADDKLCIKIEKLMEDEFPFWNRLHRYWRTNPYYNKFYNPPSKVSNKTLTAGSTSSRPKRTARPNSSATGVMTRKRKLENSTASTSRLAGANCNRQYIIVEDSPSPRCSSPDAEVETRESSSKDAAPARTAAEYKRRRPDRKDSVPSYPDGSETALTAAQKHELRMAEIELRRKELELENQEKTGAAEMRRAQIEAEAHSQREKHELMMRLMAFVTGAEEAGGRN